MDTLRGNFSDRVDLNDEPAGYDPVDDAEHEAPPSAIGQDERRMQVRAYNHWASLLQDRNFPSIEDLDPANLPDFGPFSVLLDFSTGIENPGVAFLGAELGKECGAEGEITHLSDVPARSLLSRITDHYMQILANQAPIGFEAEFVNQRSQTILYRGILLPFSSDDDTIDFIYGVINWKEVADQHTTDELMLEIDQALEDEPSVVSRTAGSQAMTDWADGPASQSPTPSPSIDGVVHLAAQQGRSHDNDSDDLPAPSFAAPEPSVQFDMDQEPAPLPTAFEQPVLDEGSMGLSDWLASARELAQEAQSSEERTRSALYEAISRAYDFSLVAAQEAEEFAELLASSGLTVQERAPMTPVVKLVFGANYDKTRLTEYAAALSHAHRLELDRGALAEFLTHADGGLKGVVRAERKLRRKEAGKPAKNGEEPREPIARKLRKIEPKRFEAVSPQGHEFGLVIIRRLPDGEVAVLGEVPEDGALIEKAAKKLLA